MDPCCVIEIKVGNRKGQMIGPFDFPAKAASYGLAALELRDGEFIIHTVHPPFLGGPRPNLRVLTNDAA
jgi:hypothetical protein